MIPCLAKEFTKFPAPLENHTYEKLLDHLKPVSKNIYVAPSIITFLSQLLSNTPIIIIISYALTILKF
jgi:hypothetical protein